MATLQLADKLFVRAEKLEQEALDREVAAKNQQRKQLSLAKAVQEGNAVVDLSALLPYVDDPCLTQAGKEGLPALEAALRSAVASWITVASSGEKGMEVDASNKPKRKADGDTSPDETDPKVRLGQGGTEGAPVQVALPAGSETAAAADPEEQKRLQDAASPNASKEGGQAEAQASAEAAQATPQPTPGQAAAAARKAKWEQMLAALQAKTREATIAEATTATVDREAKEVLDDDPTL